MAVRFIIPSGNWTQELLTAMQLAGDSDRISVDSIEKVCLARSAQRRMYPEKSILFEIDGRIVSDTEIEEFLDRIDDEE